MSHLHFPWRKQNFRLTILNFQTAGRNLQNVILTSGFPSDDFKTSMLTDGSQASKLTDVSSKLPNEEYKERCNLTSCLFLFFVPLSMSGNKNNF